jgi:hypothetical protein
MRVNFDMVSRLGYRFGGKTNHPAFEIGHFHPMTNFFYTVTKSSHYQMELLETARQYLKSHRFTDSLSAIDELLLHPEACLASSELISQFLDVARSDMLNSGRLGGHGDWIMASITVRSSILHLVSFQAVPDRQIIEKVFSDLSAVSPFLELTTSAYAQCQQQIYLLLGIVRLIRSPANLAGLKEVSENIFPGTWNWRFLRHLVAYFHGVCLLLHKDFARAASELRTAVQSMASTECSLLVFANSAYVLACLNSVEDLPDDLTFEDQVVIEAITLHRLRDFRRLGAISALTKCFASADLANLAAGVPQVILKRAIIQYLGRFRRITLAEVARVFALNDREASNSVLDLIRQGQVPMLLDSISQVLIKDDIRPKLHTPRRTVRGLPVH